MDRFKSRTLLNPSSLVILVNLIISLLVVGCRSENKDAENRATQSGVESKKQAPKENLPVLEYADTITSAELKEHIAYLASDKLAGRFSGTAGADAAADYIARHFGELELQGITDAAHPYFQNFQMQNKQMKENYLESEHAKVENWIHFGERFSHFAGEKDVELIFVGFGRDQDLAGIDIQGKLVAFLPGGPDSLEIDMDREKKKMDAIADLGAAGFLLIFEDESTRPAYARFRKAFFGDVRYYLYKTKDEAINSQRNIVIFASDLARLLGVSPENFISVLEDIKKGQPHKEQFRTSVTMKTAYDTFDKVDGRNVLAFIEGIDKRDEWIIVTAHYDHLGTHRGDVYNGADDNASGVAALLEIAEAFVQAAEDGNAPRRTILFMAPDAEEIGANGSLFYVENPLSPLRKTVVDVNIDAIGREDAQRPELKDFVYVYSSQNGRTDLNKARSKAENLLIDKPRIEIRTTAPGSDNYIFEREGVPVIAYTTGHCRDYHKPSDTKNKINSTNLHKIVRMVFVTVWELSHQEERINKLESVH